MKQVTSAQARPVPSLRERFLGCLLAGAVGDALGYPVEFMDARQILDAYGHSGVTRYPHPKASTPYRYEAQISDDTQMTLFTAAGLLHARKLGYGKGNTGLIALQVLQSYYDWLRTQQGDGTPQKGQTWLADVDALYSNRAPGITCLRALSSGMRGSCMHPINNSKGCGGVMRVAPVAMIFKPASDGEILWVDRLGAEIAALTHGHDLGYFSAALLVHILQCILWRGMGVREAVEDAVRIAPVLAPMIHVSPSSLKLQLSLLDTALRRSRKLRDDQTVIEQELGGGWVGEEALAIGAYCALTAEYALSAPRANPGLILQNCLRNAVTHSGDSDSTGAIAGNIIGAALGVQAIGDPFLKRLELKDTIQAVAEDLFIEATTQNPANLIRY